MPSSSSLSRSVEPLSERLLFADFELHPDTGELRRSGAPVKLQPQPARVLELLARRAGEIVTREEIQRQVWGAGTFVDFEQSLNFSIKQIRRALDDSATSPCFIETIPRRGYRFLAAVEVERPEPPRAPAPVVTLVPPPPPVPAAVPAAPRRPRPWAFFSVLSTLALALALGVVLGYRGIPRTPARPKVAVLPFTAPDESPESTALADGLTEDVITELAKRYPEQLGVIARTSVTPYRDTTKRPKEIGRELEVDYLVMGSVRRTDDEVEISAQLVRASDETHMWADEARGRLGVPLEREVAAELARVLELRPERDEPDHAEVPPVAYDAYLEGRQRLHEKDWTGAEAALRRAVEMAPDFARAWAMLPEAIVYRQDRPERLVPPALAAAERALELAPELAEAHLAMHKVQLYSLFDWDAAGRELERAVELEPGLARVHEKYAHYLASLGRHDAAIAEMRLAQELDPVAPVINANLAWHYYLGRRYDEAVRQARHTLEMYPDDAWTHMVLAFVAGLQGDRRAEAEALAGLAAVSGWEREVPPPARLQEPQDYWRWRLRLVEERARKTPQPPQELLFSTAALGDRERSLALLEEGCRERWGNMLVFVAVDPLMDPLRSDPRFDRVLDCIGIPDEGQRAGDRAAAAARRARP